MGAPHTLCPFLCPEFPQKHVGAELSNLRTAEAVEAAPWLSLTQTAGGIMGVGAASAVGQRESPGHLHALDAHTTEPLEDDRWMD